MADRREVLNGALRESCCENAMDPGQIPGKPAMISADWIVQRTLIRAMWMRTGISDRSHTVVPTGIRQCKPG